MNIVVISNSAISIKESNGRVLRSILPISKNNQILNFCIRGNPNYDELNTSYILISDKDALKFVTSFGIKKPKEKNNDVIHKAALEHKTNKKPFHYLIRNFIWKQFLFLSRSVKKQILNFEPDIIFLMGGDCPFLYTFAFKLSKKTKKPLLIYTAEDYPIKTYDYILQKKKLSFISRVLHKKLYKCSAKAFKYSKLCVFNSEKLFLAYKNEGFVKTGSVLPFPSFLTDKSFVEPSENNIVYAGNLPDSRCQSLLDIADVLEANKLDFSIEIFGTLKNNELAKQILKHSKILYKGFIPFFELEKKLSSAKCLLHVEGFSEFDVLDYQFAFSTKIADYLILNRPFIAYGSPEISGIDYLNKINSNFVFTSTEDLKDRLPSILSKLDQYSPDYELIKKTFAFDCVNKKVLELFESVLK